MEKSLNTENVSNIRSQLNGHCIQYLLQDLLFI